jgi:hypothetical protein
LHEAIIKSGLVTTDSTMKTLIKYFGKRMVKAKTEAAKIVLDLDSGMVSRAVLNHRNAKAKRELFKGKA